MGIPTKPPTFREINWAGIVRAADGDDFHKPEIGYQFSVDSRFCRRFNDSGANGGPYTGTSGNG